MASGHPTAKVHTTAWLRTVDASEAASSSPRAAAWAKLVSDPLVQLLAVVLSLTAGFRWVFFLFSKQIWAIQDDIALREITPWTRWAVLERDGVEPQALLLLVLLIATLTCLAMLTLSRLARPVTGITGGLGLIAAAVFTALVPPHPPMQNVDPVWWHVVLAVTGVLCAGFAAIWVDRFGGRFRLPGLALLVAPVCFLASGRPSFTDLSCVLAPALRIRLGFSLSDIYMQYDYLLSLLAVAWHWLGADPSTFPYCTRIFFYLFLLGCYCLARRMFTNRYLPALLLVTLCAVRIYANISDVNALPQVTPLRLDLWIVLLAPALFFGLEHWSVGLALGLVYFFGRSFGTLYLGSYGLVLAADFLSRRAAAKEKLPFWRDVSASLRQLAPSLLPIAVGIGAAALAFGSPISDAAATYHRLGVGMMRISPDSSYWWVAPMLAAVGWLAFSTYGSLDDKRVQATLFAVALAMANSVYFFGRSHENNILNISALLLLCLFLGMDLTAVALRDGPAWAQWTLRAAPWMLLALTGFFYSGRLFEKIDTQVKTGAKFAPVESPEAMGIYCSEIASATDGDSRVFVFSMSDYWFYERCGYVPQGYVQPLYLQPINQKVVEQVDDLLNRGYKIVVPKHNGSFDFSETAIHLPQPLFRSETPNYYIVWRKR